MQGDKFGYSVNFDLHPMAPSCNPGHVRVSKLYVQVSPHFNPLTTELHVVAALGCALLPAWPCRSTVCCGLQHRDSGSGICGVKAYMLTPHTPQESCVDRRDNNWEVKLEKEHILCSKAVYPDTTTCRQARLFSLPAVLKTPWITCRAGRQCRALPAQRPLSSNPYTRPTCTCLQVMKYGPEDARLLASSLARRNADHTATIDKVTDAVPVWQMLSCGTQDPASRHAGCADAFVAVCAGRTTSAMTQPTPSCSSKTTALRCASLGQVLVWNRCLVSASAGNNSRLPVRMSDSHQAATPII